jgi:YD repeat-containing protein
MARSSGSRAACLLVAVAFLFGLSSPALAQAITYEYDGRNLVTALSDPRVGAFGFAYDALARRTTLTRPNGTGTTATYDPASRLTALTHTGPGGPLDALTYAYDAAGNRTGDTRVAQNTQTRRYGYDLRDQLTQVERETPRGRWRAEETYTYDAVGNRLTGPAGEAATYDVAHRLTSDGLSLYTSDANGNLIQALRLADGAVTSYVYDAEDRLTWVHTPTKTVRFRYDPLGRRIERTVSQSSGEGDGDQRASGPAPARRGPLLPRGRPRLHRRPHRPDRRRGTSLPLQRLRRPGRPPAGHPALPVHRPGVGPGHRAVLLPRAVLMMPGGDGS